MTSKNRIAILPSHIDRWQIILRLGWYPVFAATLGIFIASIPGFFIIRPGGIADARFSANSSTLILSLAWIIRSTGIATGLLSLYLAMLIFRRHSDDRMALLTSFFLLAHGLLMPGTLEGLKPFLPGIVNFTAIIIPSSVVFVTLFMFAVFPDGRFVPRWTRWVVLVGFLTMLFTYYLAYLFNQSRLDFSHPDTLISIGVTILLALAMWTCILYAQIYRYRHISTLKQRQQTKWVVYGMGLWFSFQMITAIPWTYTLSLPAGSPLPLWLVIASPLWSLSILIIPVTFTIAILYYQLYDIDLIINRTLVYGTMTISVVGLYALIVGGASLLIQANWDLAGLLVTAILVGVVYRPLRAIFQRAADRIHPSMGPPPAQLSIERARSTPQLIPLVDKGDQRVVLEWKRILKPLWVLAAVLSLVIMIAALPGYLVRTPLGNIRSDLTFNPTPMVLAIHRLNLLASFLSAAFSLCLAGLLFHKMSDNLMGLFLSFYLLAHGIFFTGAIEMLEPFWPNAPSANTFIFLPILVGPATAALVGLFPDGRFVPPWSRWLVPACLLIIPFGWMEELGVSFTPANPWGWFLLGLAIITMIAVLAALVYISIYRYRHISTREQRQQTKWVVYGLSLWLLFVGISGIPWMMAMNLPTGAPMPSWLSAGELTWSLSTMFLPLSLTIAVTRYHLYKIDSLINRTLVYGGLSVSVVGVYVLVVGSTGMLFQSNSNLIISIFATSLVAVLFNPFRQRLQRAVNRLMYGERDEPLSVLRHLGERLESSSNPEDLLPTLVETVTQALKLPYAEITIRGEDHFERAAWYGKNTEEKVTFPIQYQGQTIGHMNVAMRGPGESLAESDEELLHQIAQQAGPVAQAVQLTRDLRQSRTRLVTAREEERRRLRRDLHDGLGPVLASQGLKIAAVSHLMDTDPETARRLLEELASQNEATVSEIRRLVYALRPPELDELGLVGAVRDYAAGLNESMTGDGGLQVKFQSPETELLGLPAAVEVAAYRIATEALTNVTRHAKANHCQVSFKLEEHENDKVFQLKVVDDGVGLPDNGKVGVGLNSMRERAEEVGGTFNFESSHQKGTSVVARFSLAR